MGHWVFDGCLQNQGSNWIQLIRLRFEAQPSGFERNASAAGGWIKNYESSSSKSSSIHSRSDRSGVYVNARA